MDSGVMCMPFQGKLSRFNNFGEGNGTGFAIIIIVDSKDFIKQSIFS
jgi:hypothetical protein